MRGPANEPIRVLLIQICPIVRAGLRLLLESQRNVRLVGEAPTCREAIAIAAEVAPDVILLDATLPVESAIEQLPALAASARGAWVIILLGREDPALEQRLVRLGAAGIVRKDQPSAMLFQALAKVAQGEVWLDRALVAQVLSERARGGGAPGVDPEAAKIATLTPREREVIAWVCAGLKSKAIAARLSVSTTTVRHHLTAIFNKLGVTDRVALVLYAYRYGLAHLPRE